MEENDSFREWVIVSCGRLSPEVSHLKNEGL
jgi:hypothetical protein